MSPKKGDVGRKNRSKSPKLRVRPDIAEESIPCSASSPKPNHRVAVASAALVVLAGIWANSDTLVGLVKVWSTVPDYSHGFLVAPLALGFLWLKREKCPGLGEGNFWIGLLLFTMSLTVRYVDARYYFEFLGGWSLILWVAAVVATLGGAKLLVWTLPSIGFLVFMIPLPFSLESLLSHPLQGMATRISTWSLQLLGQPAFFEGNVIVVGDNRLEVAQACSGLRLFVSITALAYVYVVVSQRPWWEKLALVAIMPLVAVAANSARIVATGLIYQATSSEWIRKVAHDSAGWGMILIAAAMFWLVLGYLKLVIREEAVMEMSALIQNKKGLK